MGKGKRKVKRRQRKFRKPRATRKVNPWVVENGKIVRPNRTCPRCGPGTFMANHVDRHHCGKCGKEISKKRGTSKKKRPRSRKRRR